MVEEFKNFFQKMVAENVEERYTIESILEDSWLNNGAVPLSELGDQET
jgi:hypothetical protein